MKKVYVLFGLDKFEAFNVLGIYTTEQQALKELKETDKDPDSRDLYEAIFVKEIPTDKKYEILGV